MIIDFHTHTFPDRIAAAAIGKLQEASRSAAFTDGTRGGLLASMRKAGIDVSVVLPVATNPLKTASINDVSVSLTGQDGLVYFGCMHPDAPDWHEELGRIAAKGIKGVKLHPVYQGTDIDDPRFVRILARAGELGLIVAMHAGDDIGFPGVVRCTPKMIRHALSLAGPVTLICAHMGGWRNWDQVVPELLDAGVYLDTAFSLGDITPMAEGSIPDAERAMLSADAFCRIVRDFGCERILFGTDCPWGHQGDTVAAIAALPLAETEKDAIFSGNARRLLGL